MKRVIIIGAGVAGLGAAFKVQRAAEAGADVECVVVERDDRVGGKLATHIIPDPEGGEYVVDGGSDAFVSGKPAIARMARLLGITEAMRPARDENKKTLIVKGDRLIEMPDGIMMFAPTKLMPLVTTPLYSWPGKLRMGLDLVLPRKERWAPGETAQDHDETLESFVVRRRGRECLDRVAEPLVGGVHASEPTQMSLAATFPNLLEMEQQFGSVVRGMLHQRKQAEAMKKTYPPKPGDAPKTFFNTFDRGMQQLALAMADAIGQERIRTGAAVTGVAKTDGTWSVALETGEVLEGDALIVATEAWAAEKLLRDVDTGIADLLATIPCSSSATVPMAFRAEDCPFDQRWFGILAPLVERRPILAVTLSSSKWSDKAPEGRVLLRGFIGGPLNQHLLEASDEELIDTVHHELVELLGMRPDAEPIFAEVFRWNGGMPQYTLGHLDRVDEIERQVGQVRGLGVAGGAYRGVGVPNCIESGERAVTKILGEWGIDLEEDRS
ncbi:MAG: protoporphyrinogen oxidase [Coriobacteriales bacterium]